MNNVERILTDIYRWLTGSSLQLQKGAGITTSTTIRTVAATDSPEVTSLNIMDDWDESDRAKVNVIVGQAGISAGSGTIATNTPRVVLATDQPVIPVSDGGASMSVDWNGTQPVTGSGTTTAALRVELPTNGTGVVGLNAGTNQIGNVFIGANASTSNQWSLFRSLTVDSTAQAIKASGGNIGGWNIINLHSAAIYIKFYNITAASVNPASDTPVLTLQVPASSSVYQEPICAQTTNSTAISVRVVTGTGDTDTTSPGILPIIEVRYV